MILGCYATLYFPEIFLLAVKNLLLYFIISSIHVAPISKKERSLQT
jgi:hypothetical protein